MLPLLPLVACSPAPTPEKARPTRRDVLLLVVDTLRADAVENSETPVLDALVARGASVQSWSSSTWTVPSMISMHTGMAVREHGWRAEPRQMADLYPAPSAPTLAGALKQEGFATHAVYANQFLDPELGLDRGFDTYRRAVDEQIPGRVASIVEQTASDQPLFLYVHLLGPHSPLAPSPASQARHGLEAHWFEGRMGLLIGAAKRNRRPGVRDAYRRAYHAVVEETDQRIGSILEALGQRREDTLVVVTSDHGELLGEHDVVGHGRHLWSELTDVPLVVEGATRLPERATSANLADLITTNLGLERSWPSPWDENLLVSQRGERVALSSDGAHKQIWGGDEPLAFDLRVDPTEQHPGAPSNDELVRAWRSRPAAQLIEGSLELAPGTVAALKTLGYLSDEP